MLAAGIAHYDKDKEHIRERLEEVANEELFRMERRLGMLDVLVTFLRYWGCWARLPVLLTVSDDRSSWWFRGATGGKCRDRRGFDYHSSGTDYCYPGYVNLLLSHEHHRSLGGDMNKRSSSLSYSGSKVTSNAGQASSPKKPNIQIVP